MLEFNKMLFHANCLLQDAPLEWNVLTSLEVEKHDESGVGENVAQVSEVCDQLKMSK